MHIFYFRQIRYFLNCPIKTSCFIVEVDDFFDFLHFPYLKTVYHSILFYGFLCTVAELEDKATYADLYRRWESL